MRPFVLYGAPGWGSVLAEAMLAWCDLPCSFENVRGFDAPGPARERLLAVNPLAQVPTLVLPDGRTMTESVAITLLLCELRPQHRLAPRPGSPLRAPYLRRLAWFGATLYPTFAYGDYPERWAPSAPMELRARVEAHRESLWRQLEAETGDTPWLIDDEPSALDVYLCAMTRWRPRREWFERECPKLARIARAADALPKLVSVWRRNFPDDFGAAPANGDAPPGGDASG